MLLPSLDDEWLYFLVLHKYMTDQYLHKTREYSHSLFLAWLLGVHSSAHPRLHISA